MSPDASLASAIADAADRQPDRPLVVGICGAQGSGKSTLAAALCRELGHAATLSLDDLYLTRAERATLARDVHPLLATRGVPGTHDVALGLDVIDTIVAGRSVALPRFDKAVDDRVPAAAWPVAAAGTRVLLFEGWCVGAAPQAPEALVAPVNALESVEDAGGVWRRYVNETLGRSYQSLFARLDMLIMLAAPSWDTVLAWRIEQEGDLRAAGIGGRGIMSDAGIARFISHFERLTRHILTEMPNRADIVVRLDEARCRLNR